MQWGHAGHPAASRENWKKYKEDIIKPKNKCESAFPPLKQQSEVLMNFLSTFVHSLLLANLCFVQGTELLPALAVVQVLGISVSCW